MGLEKMVRERMLAYMVQFPERRNIDSYTQEVQFEA